MGVRVDRQDFQATLFGGRTVVTGRVVVISPWTPLLALARLVGVALRGGRPPEAPSLPSTPGARLLSGLGRTARWFFGLSAPAEQALAADDVVLPLRVSSNEAQQGVR